MAEVIYESRGAKYWSDGRAEGYFVLAVRDTSRKSWLTGNGQWREVQRFTEHSTGTFQGPGTCLAAGMSWAVDHGMCDQGDLATGHMSVWFVDDWARSCVEYHNRVDLKMKDWRVTS